MFAKESLEECDKDIDCLRKELNKVNNRKTLMGTVSIDEDHEIKLREYDLFRVQDGDFIKL